MEIKWLEDFLSLAETRSFSRSAESRHVSQPAFSRRIKALEAWLGADLVNRSCYPPRLTPAGEAFKPHATAMLAQMNTARAQVRGQAPLPADTVEFAVPHTLSLTLFPRWLATVERRFGPLSCKLVAGNVLDAVLAMAEGNCDLLMCYHHVQQPVLLDPERYLVLRLGVERVRPYARCDRQRTALYHLPGRRGAPLPFLAYAPNAYLRRMVDLILEHSPEPFHLEKRYETDMAEGLKLMALEGHGVAFLPESAVARDVRTGRLAPAGDDRWSIEMEIRLYRARSTGKAIVDRLWQHIAAMPGVG